MIDNQDNTESIQAQRVLDNVKGTEHPDCFICSRQNPIGFKLDFRVRGRGLVSTTFSCNHLYQSYPETLHGGITSALLDATMTNCLFSMGIAAVTGELSIRYLEPVDIDSEAEVIATLSKSHSPLYYLSAELKQYGRVAVRANAKFIDRKWSKAHRNSIDVSEASHLAY